MASMPELAPSDRNRFLETSSVITRIEYTRDRISYSTYAGSSDLLRLTRKPGKIAVDGIVLTEQSETDGNGYTWKELAAGGVLHLKHSGKEVVISF